MAGFNDETGPGMIIARAIAISAIMSIVMMLMALGFMQLLSGGADLPVSTAIVLIVFAVSFIAAVVLMERAGSDQTSSIVGGAAIALCVTILVIALVSGVAYIGGHGDLMNSPGTDLNTLLTGFAICLVASLVINRLTLKL
jgi:hypothetical protein